ncbi:hypothetical protein VUR80DRAFT_718 [Thermomyces stellatus]
MKRRAQNPMPFIKHLETQLPADQQCPTRFPTSASLHPSPHAIHGPTVSWLRRGCSCTALFRSHRVPPADKEQSRDWLAHGRRMAASVVGPPTKLRSSSSIPPWSWGCRWMGAPTGTTDLAEFQAIGLAVDIVQPISSLPTVPVPFPAADPAFWGVISSSSGPQIPRSRPHNIGRGAM